MLEAGEDEKRRVDFILAAINDHKQSDLYKMAVTADLYERGLNATINNYKKIIRDAQGRAHENIWAANHKLASSFFYFNVRQENGYLLGNGVTFNDPKTKERLGTKKKPFDRQMMRIGKRAIVGGVAYGFWNLDHVDVFRVEEFVALQDEEDGALKAGIRFWQLSDEKPLRVTLFELDGYTEYIKRNGEDMTILQPKRGYILHTTASQADRAQGYAIYSYENYPGFPVVPLKYGENGESELVGKQATIDALDLARSNMVNNSQEGNLIYWLFHGAGGMDDVDLAEAQSRLQAVHALSLPDGIEADAHSTEAPFNGTQATIDELKDALHMDFMTFNALDLSAGNRTATEIEEAYANLDLKVDDFEANVTEFILSILELAGIDDEPSYTRNKQKNVSEEVQTVVTAAPHLSEDYIVRKIVTLLGEPDRADEILRQLSEEEVGRLGDIDDGEEEAESA